MLLSNVMLLTWCCFKTFLKATLRSMFAIAIAMGSEVHSLQCEMGLLGVTRITNVETQLHEMVKQDCLSIGGGSLA